MQRKPELLIAALILGTGFIFKNEIEGAMTSGGDWFTRWDSIIHAKSRKYSIPWRWIKAVAMTESNLGRAASVAKGLANPSDIQGSINELDAKSWGIMQLTLPTARELVGSPITAAYLNSAENSFELGTRYLAKMNALGLKQAVMPAKEFTFRAYNGGPGFQKTTLGKTLTPLYYAKVVTNIGTILTRQPGDEMEIG